MSRKVTIKKFVKEPRRMDKLGSLDVPTNNAKHYNMKQFINSVSEFIQTKAEDIASNLSRNMQLLSVSVDLSIFDPHTSVASEFFVSLHDLLSNVEPRSTLAWCCVNVLSLACKNPSSRNALIHTYEFLPLLSRLLGDHLTVEKKLRLLELMQELTCGIRISWQIPHLPHLMDTLTKWVDSENEDVVTYSLGILVNLCYKNLPAIYVLSRSVDIKKFVRMCVPLQGIKIEVHVCKLLIILEYMNGQVPKATFFKLIEVTFKSLLEAYKARDVILLRHVVEFFLDVSQQENHQNVIKSYEKFAVETESLLIAIESHLTHDDQSGENAAQQEPECISLILQFLNAIIEMQVPKIEQLHQRIASIAVKWIHNDTACSQGLAVLRTVAVSSAINNDIIEMLMRGLTVFHYILNVGEETVVTSIDHNKRLGALMQVLKILVESPITKTQIMEWIEEGTLRKVFVPLLGLKSPRERASDASTMSVEAISLYVHTLALIAELAQNDSYFANLRDELTKYKQIHMVLAQALYTGSKDTKATVLKLAANQCILADSVSNAMVEMQSLVETYDRKSFNTNGYDFGDSAWCFPFMSTSQLDRLDEIIKKLKEAIMKNNLINVSTSDVMELFDYKLASMRHMERATIASMEAASERCTHLQHRTAQLTTELNRLHQLFFHAQHCHEEATKSNEEIRKYNLELSNKYESEKGRHKVAVSQLTLKEKALTEKTQELEDTMKRLQTAEESRNAAEEQISDLRKVISKLEENLVRKEKLVEKKEEMNLKLNVAYENLKVQTTQLEKRLQLLEVELTQKTAELDEKSKELSGCKQLIDTITKLTHSQTRKP